MKKILIVLALLASFQVADAQSVAAAKKAVESAEAAAQNAKKATKAATWIKLGQSYLDAFNAPAGNVWVGAGEAELKLAMGGEKPTATEEVVLNGEKYVKQIYANKNLYFNGNGQVEIIEVTKPVVDNALGKARDAFKKAYELDSSAKAAKEINAGLKTLVEKYNQEAYTAYSMGDIEKASKLFEDAFNASVQKPSETIDTSALYNAGFTAWSSKDYSKAKNLFDKCISYNYYADNGEVYAKLANCVENLDTTAAGKAAVKDYLEKGFTKFPQSQSLLIGLINYYVNSGEDTDRLFTLIDDAKKNEPDNPSLYYVEGNIRAQLGQYDEAVAAYEKCAQIDPKYVFGFVGEGLMYYNQALDLQEKAQNELDDAKYAVLFTQFETALKNCIEPFEKVFNTTTDENIKTSVAEYLKNACYRFIDTDPKYKEAYEKYSSLLK